MDNIDQDHGSAMITIAVLFMLRAMFYVTPGRGCVRMFHTVIHAVVGNSISVIVALIIIIVIIFGQK